MHKNILRQTNEHENTLVSYINDLFSSANVSQIKFEMNFLNLCFNIQIQNICRGQVGGFFNEDINFFIQSPSPHRGTSRQVYQIMVFGVFCFLVFFGGGGGGVVGALNIYICLYLSCYIITSIYDNGCDVKRNKSDISHSCYYSFHKTI